MTENWWYVQPNDIIGGWIVTNLNLPYSAYDYRPDGDESRRAYVIAECHTKGDAQAIARLLNIEGYYPRKVISDGT